MNFFNFILLALGNQRGSLDLEGSLEDAFDDANLDDLGAEEDDPTTDIDEDDEGQPDEEPEELSLEDQLEKVEGDEVDTQNLLEAVNGLGIIRKGLPVEFDDVEKIKEALSKGFDYTQKTMELSELKSQTETEIQQMRSEFEREKQAFTQEQESHQEILQTYPILQNALQMIQQSDPELFQELDSFYQKAEQSMGAHNPVLSQMDKRFKELEKKLEGTGKETQEKQFDEIRENWEKELTETQKELAPKLRKLGVRPDWQKVKEIWSGDSSNKMTVKSALFAAHGDKIQAALESQSKLAKTKKNAARLGVETPQEEQEESVFGMESGNDMVNEAFKIANSF